MKKTLLIALLCAIIATIASCGGNDSPAAPAVKNPDSAAVMTTYGVSKLISDSGLIRYKIVAEEWKVFERTNPPRHEFKKGLLLERFNQKFHIEMYITADTAYWYDQNLWELRGRVRVWNEDGTVFDSQKLYWNMSKHEFYSNVYSHLKTPDKEVEGTNFVSDERMRRYTINNTRAVFPLPENGMDADSVPPPAQ